MVAFGDELLQHPVLQRILFSEDMECDFLEAELIVDDAPDVVKHRVEYCR